MSSKNSLKSNAHVNSTNKLDMIWTDQDALAARITASKSMTRLTAVRDMLQFYKENKSAILQEDTVDSTQKPLNSLKQILGALKNGLNSAEPQLLIDILDMCPDLLVLCMEKASPETEAEIASLFISIIPVLMGQLGSPSADLKIEIIDLLTTFISETNQAGDVVKHVAKSGLENNDWRIRSETIDVLYMVVNRDSGGIDFPELVSALILRLRDVSEAVVASSIKMLVHIRTIVGQNALMGYVNRLSRISRQLFRQHQAEILQPIAPGLTGDPKPPRHNGTENNSDKKAQYDAKTDHDSTKFAAITSAKKNIKITEREVEALELADFEEGASKTMFGFAPSKAVSVLFSKENEWKSKAAAIDMVETALKEIQLDEFYNQMSQFCIFLHVLLKDSNFKVNLAALNILGSIIDLAGPRMQPIVPKLTEALVMKFVDNKIIIRQTCHSLLLKLMEISYPSYVYESMLPSITHENPRVREEIVNSLIAGLLTFPNHEVEMSFLASNLIAALNDTKAKVKYVAVEACAVLASRGNQSALINIFKEYGLDKETIELLTLRFADFSLPHLGPDGCVEHLISKTTAPTPSFGLYSDPSGHMAYGRLNHDKLSNGHNHDGIHLNGHHPLMKKQLPIAEHEDATNGLFNKIVAEASGKKEVAYFSILIKMFTITIMHHLFIKLENTRNRMLAITKYDQHH